MRIAILTGGGDVPGLNPCIKTLVHRATDAGYEAMGIRRGWHGLLFFNPDGPETHGACTMRLNKSVVRTIHRSGGTMLHSSRTNPSRTPLSEAPDFLRLEGESDDGQVVDFTGHVLRVLEYLEVDVLIPIGGEDTLGFAARIHREGFPIVSIPKTMDNDVQGTDYCIGFSTAISRSVQFIHQIRSAVGSHERIGVVELFGRLSGATSLYAAYLADADRAIISEVPFDVEKLATLLAKDREENPSHYAIMTISEGAKEIEGETVETGEADAFGHKKLGGIGSATARQLAKITGIKTMYQQVGYLMRSGPPDALDTMVASNYAHLAMDLVVAGEFGQMVALQGGRYTCVSADVPSRAARSVDVEAFYDVENYRPRMKHILNKPMFLY